MRKSVILSMAVMLTAMVGCQQYDEVFDVQENKVEQTYIATFENGADSRTALDESNNVLWSENDQISVFGGTTANTSFILKEGANTTYGEFGINSAVAITETGSTTELSANAAYYPYDSNVTVSENAGSFTFDATFPAEQTFSASGTFGLGASPMVAVTADKLDANLKFKNVGAIFRLQLKGEATITKVVFSAEADIAGDVEITASNTSLPSVNVVNGTNTIVLDCGEGVALSTTEATNFIVAMLPTENLGDLTITIYDNAGKKMSSTWNSHSTIERSKAYSTAEVVYSGDENANTVASVQEQLDNATGATTIQLEPGVDYGTLVFRQAGKGSVVDITDIGGDAAGNEKFRKFENITILGAPGATVDQIDFQVGWLGNSEGASYIEVKDLTVDGVTFSGEKTAFNLDGSKGSWLGIDGLNIVNCKMNDASGSNRFVFQQITGYKERYDKSNSSYVMTTGVKNLTINSCEITGAYQVIESRAMENLTITNNTFESIAARDMLITADATHYPGVYYTGTITITGNKSNGSTERFLRADGLGDVNLIVKNNTITNYKGADYDYIKVTGHTGTAEIENNTCSYYVETVDKFISVLANAVDNVIIKLAGVDYGNVSLYNSTNNGHRYNYANYEAKNVKIEGEDGASFTKLRLGENDYQPTMTGWTFENITFTGEGLVISMNNEDVLVNKCKFVNAELQNTGTNTYQATNFKVNDCTFEGSRSDDRKTQMSLQNSNGVTVTGCKFNNSEYSAINMSTICGDVEIAGNTINQTASRPFRFVIATDAVTLSLTGNTIVSDGDSNGELLKVTADSGITVAESNVTLSGNTWNGKSDAEVSAGIAADGAYIVK